MALILIAGFASEKSKGLSYAIMAIIFILICFSYDENDFIVYSNLYKTIARGGESPYEPLFTLSMKIGNFFGLSYLQYRMAVTAVELLLIHSTIRKMTEHTALTWALFLIYPMWIMTTLARFFMAFSVAFFGLRYLLSEKKSDGWKLAICIVVASLIHNSLWACLGLLLIRKAKPKKILITCLVVTAVFLALGPTNLLFRLFELLPTNESYLDKYMSGSYANLSGMIYNFLRHAVIMVSGCYSVYLYRKMTKKTGACDAKTEKFMNFALSLNYASPLLLAAVYYTTVATRLYYLVMLVNVIAMTVALSTYPRKALMRNTWKWASLGVCLLLSVLYCTIESSVVFEYVLQMHFETNDVINFFQNP